MNISMIGFLMMLPLLILSVFIGEYDTAENWKQGLGAGVILIMGIYGLMITITGSF